MENKLINILKSIGLIFLILFFPAIFFVLLNINISNISDTKYIIYLTISNIILIGIFILIYRKTLVDDLKSYIKDFSNNFEIGIKYWIIGFGIMTLSNLFITYILNKGIAGNEQEVRNYLDLFPLFMVFNTVIYAPLTEELTFRKSIRDVIDNKWVYGLVSGLVFGMLHISSYMANWTDLVYLIPYSSLGVAFALLYYKTDNIFSSITMHAVHNLLAVVVYLLGASL
jgi:membrane protease YdiL (CAAX protease family)